MHRTSRPLLAVMAAFVLVVGLVATASTASAATVPTAPASCSATVVTGGVQVEWTAPGSDGGAAITKYAVKIKGDPSFTDNTIPATSRSWLWQHPYLSTSVFQVRAVNSVGFGPWCEASLGGPPPPVNQAPSVNAGADQSVTLPAGITLAGSASDDGLPAGSSLSTTWAKTSGPGTVTFGNASSLNSSASFSVAGSYVLTLSASDGSLTSTDSETVTVAPAPPSRPWLPFTSSSWDRTPLTALFSGSNATKTSAMRAYIDSHDPHNNPNLNGVTGGWGVTYSLSTCSDPVWKIGTVSGGLPTQFAWLKTDGFHISASAIAVLQQAAAAGQTDLPIEVQDRCGSAAHGLAGGFTVWASQVKPVAGNTFNVLSAGAFDETSNGLDQRVVGSNSTLNERSRGVIPDSMTIRHDQLKYAVDNHTDIGQRLEIFWWETDSTAGKISPPMAGFEGGQSGWGAEGQVIGVSPSFSTASCTPAAAAVVRTLQNYGAYIGDNAGNGGTSLKMENDHGQWSDLPVTQRALDSCGLTWSDFVAY